MSFTPTNSRTFAANTGLGIKLTPSNNSPYPRTPRSPNKNRSLYESGLSLKRIIGTTISSPTGFDSLPSSKIFAYTAGAAAVVVELDEDLQYSQRFFRARPTAVPLKAVNKALYTPSTPTNNANDSRNRVVASLRDSVFGHSPSNGSTQDWGDSPSSKTWTSRERIKAATCLSMSRDGRFLAVGETGYTPRVLIFSLHESSDSPLVILNEHTFGVKAVAFSPDGRFLASLGTVNDGFIYVWQIDARTGAAKLHSSNKCTSFIKGMAWLGGSLITVGTRYVKVWKIEESGSISPSKQRFMPDGIPPVLAPPTITKTLAGRNCLLGPLVEATFTCVVSVSDSMAIVCSDRGDVCLLDESAGQRLVKVAHAGFGVTCMAVDLERQLVRLGGKSGLTRTLSLDAMIRPAAAPESRIDPDPAKSGPPVLGHLIAMAFVADISITVDTQHAITITKKDVISSTKKSNPLTAHCDAVLGVRLLSQPNDRNANFFTWSATGEVLFWDLEGHSKGSIKVEIEQSQAGDEDSLNQCSVIRQSPIGGFFVTGDKYGVLRVIEESSGSCTFSTTAHGSEILDIAIHQRENTVLIATCGRDRTVQLFRKMTDTWILLQTMDEHTASVCTLLFCDKGETLISASTDRTIQIRQLASREINGQEIIAAIPLRVVNLKASPVSMTLSSSGQASSFVVSLMDRTVTSYEVSTGRLISSFRATDMDGNDAVVMDALVMGKPSASPGRPTILAGISGTDKSVRIYDCNTGSFLDREWGHTSSVTDVALLELSDPDRITLISTGSDGTIMIWDLSSRTPDLFEPASSDCEQSPPKDSASARPPLRRVLSKAELAEFQRPSPVTTPTGRSSPPRPLRRRTSKYSMAIQSPKLTIPPMPPVPGNNGCGPEDSNSRRSSPRTRSRSPPSPNPKDSRRQTLVRGRTKSTGNFSESGTLNMATEQVCRALRSYRKKLGTVEAIRDDALKELDQELRLTAKALGEKTLKNKAMSETVLAGLLDQYSERLVSIFDEKLRLTLKSNISSENESSVNGSQGASTSRRTSERLGSV